MIGELAQLRADGVLKRYDQLEKIRGIAERRSAQVIFGHDANQIKELRTGPGNYYT